MYLYIYIYIYMYIYMHITSTILYANSPRRSAQGIEPKLSALSLRLPVFVALRFS